MRPEQQFESHHSDCPNASTRRQQRAISFSRFRADIASSQYFVATLLEQVRQQWQVSVVRQAALLQWGRLCFGRPFLNSFLGSAKLLNTETRMAVALALFASIQLILEET
jgi:hypothetical protein